MELPQAVKMLALHRQAFHDNYRDLWPNRILMSESFACDLVSEMMHLLGNSGMVVPYGTDANLKNIIRPGTTIFNMRITIVPDEFIAQPFELACAQELILPHNPYLSSKRIRMMSNWEKRYNTIDLSQAPITLIENKS